MVNSDRKPLNLGMALGLMAFLALGLGSVSVPADTAGLLGVLGVALLLWSVSFAVDFLQNRDRPPAQAVGLVGAVLIGFGGLELIGLLTALSEHQPEQAAWFASALAFASVGLVSARRAGPSDPVLASQMFFHLVVGLPALGAPMNLGLRWLAGPESEGVITGASGLMATLTLISTVVMPALFLLLMAVVAVDLATRSDPSRASFWTALVAAEAALVVLLFRGV